MRFGRRLLGTAAVAAIVAFATPWQLLAQTTGQQTVPGQTTAAPQAAPAGQAPSAAGRTATPAPQPPPTAQSQAPAAGATPAAAVVQPSSFPLKLPPMVDWTFGGFFGTFDEAQLQRGYQVYKEVCSNCHSMNLVAFRNLGDDGGPRFSPDEVKSLAASYMVTDGP